MPSRVRADPARPHSPACGRLWAEQIPPIEAWPVHDACHAGRNGQPLATLPSRLEYDLAARSFARENHILVLNQE